MAFSYAQIDLRGHIGNVEVRSIRDDLQVVEFSICYEKSIKKEGQYSKVANWFNVYRFNPSEYMLKNLVKGNYVEVIGEPEMQTYEKEGKKHYIFKVSADKMLFPATKRDDVLNVGAPDMPPISSDTESDLPF